METVHENKNQLYPVFLKLEEMQILLVGGGNVSLEKLHSLLSNSPRASVTIVAPMVKEEIRRLVWKHPSCTIVERAFEPADLDEKELVIVATGDQKLNEEIRLIGKEKGVLVNVADTPELCDFYLGSIVQRGNLKIAISTNGKSPTAAKRIKEVLHESLPAELDDVIENLHKVRNKLNGDFDYKVKKLNSITKVLVEKETIGNEQKWKKIATYSLVGFGLMLVGHVLFSYIPFKEIVADGVAWYKTLDANFHWLVLAGFLAQIVDGALGMGYGVTSATVLLSAGIAPASISASVHTAEIFSTAASGYSHYRFGNVNKKLFKALVIPGVLGSVAGALLLTKLGNIDGGWLRVLLASYTLFLGIKFIINAFREAKKQKKFKHYSVLAGLGGFFDSFGGGGWGPLVTTTLIDKGRSPKYVIGSVSITEFFVTFASALTFFTVMGISHWQVILALVIGGVVAAPIAARLAGKMPKKTAFFLLGVLVIIWSARILIKFF